MWTAWLAAFLSALLILDLLLLKSGIQDTGSLRVRQGFGLGSMGQEMLEKPCESSLFWFAEE